MSDLLSIKKPKLLCIDDDPSIVKSIERLLSPNFEFIGCANLADARNQLAKTDVAIVIADHSLPDGRGLDFLAELSTTNSEAVRVLLSGFVDPSELSTAINKGTLHRLIIKPWDNDYLSLQMLEAYQSHKLLHEKNTLARLAITDPITELNNHRHFQDVLKIESQRALRHSRSLSLLMIDIDHFKKFNDRFGHPAGDKLLKEVSQRIIKSVRNLDTVARYGGEEFAVLMPDTLSEDAFKVGERIRQSLEATPFDVLHRPEKVTVTISVGVASLKPHQNLVEEADKALYKAKNSGRNRSVLAE